MAEAAVSSAVETLGNLLIKKAVFLQGVAGQVQRLQNELKRMQYFLKDAAQKQAKDERVRHWISEIREVAHDAEDAIEIFILKDENRGLGCACFLGYLFHLFDIYRVGREIESIWTRLQDIERSRQRYGIQNLGEGNDSPSTRRRSEHVKRRRRSPRFENDKQIIGLNEDAELLLQNSILEEKEGLSIALIVGMGGIGKSTLARKIYDHAAVAAGFEYRAWVVVSSEFAPEDIIKHILLQVQNSEEGMLKVLTTTREMEESMTDRLALQEMLQEMLRKQLEGKQYFIVLDDVWERTDWEYLRVAFPDQQGKRSRLLFTSRNQIITKHHGYIHKMRLLNPDESRELLFKTAPLESKDRKCPRELESVAREILKKCHGLPLAIMVVGGLLVDEGGSKSGWEKVLRQIKNHHLETNEISSDVSAILELSYHNLPPWLKACFLCLSFFEEDAIIQARRLIHIWVVQGLISVEEVGGEETMEELARKYLNELVNRNLVQVNYMSVDDRVKTCHVHDLLRDLSIRKAKEEIGLKISREDQGNSSNSSYKPRHLVFQSYNAERIMLDSLNQNRHVRSLFFYEVDDSSVAYLCTSSYWKRFELLRILDISYISLNKVCSGFFAFIGLRYLRLTGIWTCGKLPSRLFRLKTLEVLDVGVRNVELPDVTWEVDRLRHFYAHRIWGAIRFDNWKNLETLKKISPSNLVLDNPRQLASCRLRKLGIVFTVGTTELSKLRTSPLEKVKTLVQLHLACFKGSCPTPPIPLDHLHHLTKLKLSSESGEMTQSPAARMLPQNLSCLTLKYILATDDPMPELGKLQNLLYLKLSDAYRGTEMRVLHDGFPRLEVLSLLTAPNLSCIHIEGGGMPELQRLEIQNCPQLQIENLPEHIKAAAVTKH